MQREKRVDLRPVGVIGLWICLPDERALAPLRAYEGILAAHEIQVAGSQEAVVVRLRHEGQGGEMQGTAPRRATGFEGTPKPIGNLPARRTIGNAADDGLVAARPDFQQGQQGGSVVTEHRYCQCAADAVLAEIGVPPPDQPAGPRDKSRKEEMLGQWQGRVRRGQAVTTRHPALGREMFEIEPDRRVPQLHFTAVSQRYGANDPCQASSARASPSAAIAALADRTSARAAKATVARRRRFFAAGRGSM